MIVVRELKNISQYDVEVKLDGLTSVYLRPGDTLKDKKVNNLSALQGLVEVKQDLSEVNPINEGLQYLKG